MKYLLLFLLSFSAFANHRTEISNVFVYENTMIIKGEGLIQIQKATLGNKPVGIMEGKDIVLFCKPLNKIPCKNERWIPGTYTLKLFKYGKSVASVKYPVTITGNEYQERPPVVPIIPPSPVGRDDVLPIIPPSPIK